MKNSLLDFELLFEGHWTPKDEGSTFQQKVAKPLAQRQNAKELIIDYTDVKKEKKIATYKLGYAKYYTMYSRLVFALRVVKTKELGEGCETVN